MNLRARPLARQLYLHIMLQRHWRAETGFFLVLWLLLLLTGRSSLLRDPGTFWHTVVGERMLDSGELVRADPFSFTFGGQPWALYQWLGEVVMALLYRLGGFDTLLLATVTLLAALYAWIGARLVRAGLHWLPAALLVALVVAASSYHFHARPHLVTIAFLGWTYVRLCDFEAGRLPFRGLLWLPPAFVLWVNLHGGVLAGIALVVLAVGGWAAWGALGKETPLKLWSRALQVLGLLLGLGLTPLVNPYGLELPRTWWTIMTADLPKFIQEHAPPDFTSTEGIALLTLGALYVLLLLNTQPRWPRVTWLLPLAFLYLAAGRVRHGPLFSVTAVLAMAEMLPHSRWAVRLTERGSDLLRVAASETADVKPQAQYTGWILPALAVLIAALTQAAGLTIPVIGCGWAQLDPARWPVDLIPRLREHESAMPQPIFNELTFGGFLLRFAPGYQVFIDDRCELYGNEFLLAYDEAARVKPAQVDRWQARYGFQLALVRNGSAFDEYLSQSPHWQLIAECPVARLYQHRE